MLTGWSPGALPADWRARWADAAAGGGFVGRGPRRAECAAAVDAFFIGINGGAAPTGGPPRAFFEEGAAAARALDGLPPRPLPEPWDAFARVGRGVVLPWTKAPPEGAGGLDGWGFGSLLFSPGGGAFRRVPPATDPPWAYPHGLGRALYFRAAGHPERLRRAVAAYPPSLHAALWQGSGFAGGFAAGGLGLAALAASAGPHAAAVQRGADTGLDLRGRLVE